MWSSGENRNKFFSVIFVLKTERARERAGAWVSNNINNSEISTYTPKKNGQRNLMRCEISLYVFNTNVRVYFVYHTHEYVYLHEECKFKYDVLMYFVWIRIRILILYKCTCGVYNVQSFILSEQPTKATTHSVNQAIHYFLSKEKREKKNYNK